MCLRDIFGTTTGSGTWPTVGHKHTGRMAPCVLPVSSNTHSTELDGVQDPYSTRGVRYGKRGVFYYAPYYLLLPPYDASPYYMPIG